MTYLIKERVPCNKSLELSGISQSISISNRMNLRHFVVFKCFILDLPLNALTLQLYLTGRKIRKHCGKKEKNSSYLPPCRAQTFL